MFFTLLLVAGCNVENEGKTPKPIDNSASSVYPQCAGSYEKEKCEALQRESQQESTEVKAARAKKLNDEYHENLSQVYSNQAGSQNVGSTTDSNLDKNTAVFGSFICYQQGMMDKKTNNTQEMGTDKDGFLVKFNGASGLLSLNNAAPYSSGPWSFSYLETKEDINTYSVNDKFFRKFHFKVKNRVVELMLQETDKYFIVGECKQIDR
jgi:hypothetical protein